MKGYCQDAPEWAKWIAWDHDGVAGYFNVEPSYSHLGKWGSCALRSVCPQHDDINKAGQLEKRPEEEL